MARWIIVPAWLLMFHWFVQAMLLVGLIGRGDGTIILHFGVMLCNFTLQVSRMILILGVMPSIS
jgi:hypothetical protein